MSRALQSECNVNTPMTVAPKPLKSYNNLEPIHYHLMSDFYTGPNILETLLQPGRHALKTFP